MAKRRTSVKKWKDVWKRKETHIIIGVTIFVGAGLLILFFIRNSPSPIVITDVPSATVVVPFTKLMQGEQSVVERRVNYVLTSPTELSELWKTIDAPGKPPTVNFKTHAVLAIFAGKGVSASITVAKIEDSNTRLVSIAIAKPDGVCAMAQSTASPYQIVSISVTSLPLVHKDFSTTVSCGQ